jgi:hypothetical protein
MSIEFHDNRRRIAAFSLVEMMVTSLLLMVIVIGLVAMFHQTQRAFIQSMSQKDYTESGRAILDMTIRDLEQITPFYSSTNVSFYATNNFIVTPPVTQQLLYTNDFRTNRMETLFFITKYNQQYIGIGYVLGNPNSPQTPPADGIGTLYRYTTPVDAPGNLFNDFVAALNTPSSIGAFHQVADGVVDFEVRAYDTNGVMLTTNAFAYYQNNSIGNPTYYSFLPHPLGVNPYAFFMNFNLAKSVDQQYYQSTGWLQQGYYMTSNAVPAAVEVQMGLLEADTLARVRGFESPIYTGNLASLNYLANHAGQVHLYVQRAQVRGCDPTAY